MILSIIILNVRMNLLFNQRHASEYEAYTFRDASSVAYLLPKAEDFIDAVESLALNRNI